MRAFIGVKLEKELSDGLGPALTELEKISGLKTVKPENIHITLRFLGEIDEDMLDDLKATLSVIKMPSFEMCLKGVGAFPNLDKAKVIWAGVEVGFSEFKVLNSRVDISLEGLGFERDIRFHPHATIARAKSGLRRHELNEFMKRYQDHAFGSQKVWGFEIFKSTLTPTGPIYDLIHEVRLDD